MNSINSQNFLLIFQILNRSSLVSSHTASMLGLFNRTGLRFMGTKQSFHKSDLTVQERPILKPKPAADHQYTFGGLSTDYMLEINYDVHNGGWQRPLIKANEPFELDPANATLHYSIECFEGLKAYITHDQNIF